MPAALPPFLIIATIKTATKTAQDRFLEIFPPLVAHSTTAEPDTLSYYFFTSTASDDHAIYGFEGYPNAAALTEVHSKSPAYTRQSAILAEEKICTVDVDRFRPIAGFLLRDGETEKPVEAVLITKTPGSDAAKAEVEGLARAALEDSNGASTFVVMEHLATGELWTFERYTTKAKAEKRQTADGSKTSEFVEANVGFLQK